MKKVLSLVIAIVLALSSLSGCGKRLEKSVLGTWYLVEDVETNEMGTVYADTEEPFLILWEDGTGKLNLPVSNNEFSTTTWAIVNGDNLKIDYEAPLIAYWTFCYQVKVKGDTMVWGDFKLERAK